ncbi:MAG: hypothetical protein Q7R35_03310 [Elusimicrobiota bacterium]|nr:hypothetical protein [Elusimicrobiota bacterium]
MDLFSALELVIVRPETLVAEARPEGFGRTGLLGYFFGTLGLFVCLRMFSAVPPGMMSFGVVLTLVLAANFFFASSIHLFMDFTGAKGSASRLFLAFGCSDYFLALLVPLAFFAKLDVLNGFLWFCLCFLVVIYARVRLVRRLYPVSTNKALLSVWLPYAGLCAVFFVSFVYSLAWLVWLVI